jgi:hypothetical protein
VPIGVAYDKVYALLPEGDEVTAQARPWFVSDSLLGSAMVMAHVPFGPMFVRGFGGILGVWHMALDVLSGNVQMDLARTGETVGSRSLSVDGGRFGWGWQAGGAVGVSIGPISVDLNVTYRLARSQAQVSGEYYVVDESGPSVSGPLTYGPTAISIRFAGLSVGVDVRYQM